MCDIFWLSGFIICQKKREKNLVDMLSITIKELEKGKTFNSFQIDKDTKKYKFRYATVFFIKRMALVLAKEFQAEKRNEAVFKREGRDKKNR